VTTTSDGDQQRIIKACNEQPFRFEQGASLHVGILAMVERPSGPHDEDPFVTGTWHGGRSHGQIDLSQLQAADEAAPNLDLWFDTDRTALDISASFEGVPVDALSGSEIPSAVLRGAVMVERRGDAGDGITALLTQMCAGKIVIDPHAMLDLIDSEHLDSFAEHQVEDAGPLRAFNAGMSIQAFLDTVGLTSTALINQIAVLGYDLRRELGSAAVDAFNNYLHSAQVQLAWFVDESDRIHTAQVVLALTDFISQLFTSIAVIEQLATEEQVSVQEMTEFIDKSAEAGRLVYVHAIWQTFSFANDIAAVVWPDAVDLSVDVAAQASRLRTQTDTEPKPGADPILDAAASEATASDVAVGEQRRTVTIGPGMLDDMRASSGAIHFVLSSVQGDAVAAMQAAQAAVMEIGHPDEPGEPLASFLSDVVAIDSGAQFWADIIDMEEQPIVLERLLAAVVDAVSLVVTAAHLSSRLDS
jgi:hypothetical protein